MTKKSFLGPNGHADAPKEGPPSSQNTRTSEKSPVMTPTMGVRRHIAVSITDALQISKQTLAHYNTLNYPKSVPQNPGNQLRALMDVAHNPQKFLELFNILSTTPGFGSLIEYVFATGVKVRTEVNGPFWTVERLTFNSTANISDKSDPAVPQLSLVMYEPFQKKTVGLHTVFYAMRFRPLNNFPFTVTL